MLETKCIKSGGKSRFSLSFLDSIVNDITRKLYTVGIHLTIENEQKERQILQSRLLMHLFNKHICFYLSLVMLTVE